MADDELTTQATDLLAALARNGRSARVVIPWPTRQYATLDEMDRATRAVLPGAVAAGRVCSPCYAARPELFDSSPRVYCQHQRTPADDGERGW